jgi:Flp pilus assembly protein TadD
MIRLRAQPNAADRPRDRCWHAGCSKAGVKGAFKMRNSTIVSKALATLTLTTVLAACEDNQPAKPSPTTTPSSIVAPTQPQTTASTEPPRPSIPTTPPEVTTPPPSPKVEPTAMKDDDDDKPSHALEGSRKALAAGDKERALKLATVAVLRTPMRSGAYNALGRAQLQLGKRKEAIASFEKAVELNPRNSYAQNNLGLALIYDGRYEDAVDALEEAVQMEPVEGYMWNNLGMAYEHLDRLEEARDAYDKAVQMDNDHAHDSLARLKGVKSVIRTAKADTDNSTKETATGNTTDSPETR